MFFVRHCESEDNAKGIWGGNAPLSAKGQKQALSIEKRPASIIVSSSLERALQTAMIVYPDREIVVDERFNEIGFGKFEGVALGEENKALADFCIANPDVMHFLSKGDDVEKRVAKAIKAMDEYPDDTVIFSHHTLISCIIATLNGDIKEAKNIPLKNGEVVEVNA